MRESRTSARSPFAGYANAPFSVARRRRKAVLLAVVGLLVAACSVVAVIDSFVPHVRHVTVEVPGLVRELRLLQVTDLGSRRFGAHQSGLTQLLGANRYDAIVLTGDMCNDDPGNGDSWAPSMSVAAKGMPLPAEPVPQQ